MPSEVRQKIREILTRAVIFSIGALKIGVRGP